MSYRLAINGYGRIGRCILRALYERPDVYNRLSIVAINEPADIGTMAYLTRFDSVHGRFSGEVSFSKDTENILQINENQIAVSHAHSPENLIWRHQGIDLLLECSGSFASRETAQKYLDSGPERLLFSQPATAGVDNTVVFGVNHTTLNKNQYIVSNGSCTTNCIIPVLQLLHNAFRIEEGATTTIHSAMNDQPVTDAGHHSSLQLTRSAMQAVVPVDTQLAKGIDRLLPELKGRFSSLALRVPTVNVSLIDLTVRLSVAVSAEDINQLFKRLSVDEQFSSIIGYSSEPHASVDFNHDSRSVIIDGTQTRVSNGNMVKIICWFDNEWGFANRMLDTALTWMNQVSR